MPSYRGLQPASERASRTLARIRASGTRCEQVLRSLLWRSGLRFRKDVRVLPGRPDIVFTKARVVVFCDGDFWHGRGWSNRKKKLKGGHNASYWVEKIQGNMRRDRRVARELRREGWTVLRYWETDVLVDPERIAEIVMKTLDQRQRGKER